MGGIVLSAIDLYPKFQEVCDAFRINGKVTDYQENTFGNINSTYIINVRLDDGYEKNFFLQRVNRYVFNDPAAIMRNIDLVTTYIIDNYPDDVRIHYHHTKDRKNYYADNDNLFWRMSNYIDSVTFNNCADRSVLYGVGKAFGDFQRKLNSFDASLLKETIPDFHNTKKRLDKLNNDARTDEYSRVNEVKEELEFLRSVYGKACLLGDLLEKGELPLRVTHNDTKTNNVLFDKETHLPLVVIDLDTMMPGLVAHDFGDAVRFAASTAEEDEPDVRMVAVDLEKYKAFCEGFISSIAGIVTENEIKYMALGAVTMTVELASRFLDDYITGDKYFKTKYPGHNLVRARCQIALAKDMLEKETLLENIVKDIYKSCIM